MKSKIVELWNGDIEPIRNLALNNAELKKLEEIMQKNINGLEENLCDKGKEFFKKYNECINEYMVVLSEQVFYEGFCLATRIVAEGLLGAQ